MGVHGTYCQLCGLPVNHDHYVPAERGFAIYRTASPPGGQRWDGPARPFPFGPEHAWLTDAVVLPWDDDRVLRGQVEDGALEDVMVFEGGDEGLAFHHACWVLQGSPQGTGPAVRSNGSFGWAVVEPYQGQLFDFHAFASDGKAWMLADPTIFERSRLRLEHLLTIAKVDPRETTSISELLELDRDWAGVMAFDAEGRRAGMTRVRTWSLERADKTGFETLLRVSRELPGEGLPDARTLAVLEFFEAEFKQRIEAAAAGMHVVTTVGAGRAEWLAWVRDEQRSRAALEGLPGLGATVVTAQHDPDWLAAPRAIARLRA